MSEPRRFVLDRLTSEPWRNGAGTTRTLASDAEPDGGAWTWRVSVAEILGDSVFSTFPGVQRHLMLIDGTGLTLIESPSGARMLLREQGDIASFDGEVHIEARIEAPKENAPVRVMNLMYRANLSGTLNMHRGAVADLRQHAAASAVLLVLGGCYSTGSMEANALRGGEGLVLAPHRCVLTLPCIDDDARIAIATVFASDSLSGT